MRNLLFLTTVTIGRILMAACVLFAIYNPWVSLYGWVYPGRGLPTAAYEDQWLFKAIAVLIVMGLLILFIRTAHKALGPLGLIFVLAVLLLFAYTPFYFQYLPLAPRDIFDVCYFGVLPVLLGIGLSAGYVNRYLAGTLQTASMEGHHGGTPQPDVTHTASHHG